MIPLIAKTWPAFSATRISGMNQKRLNWCTGLPKLGNEKVGRPSHAALCTPEKLTWHAVPALHLGSISATM